MLKLLGSVENVKPVAHMSQRFQLSLTFSVVSKLKRLSFPLTEIDD